MLKRCDKCTGTGRILGGGMIQQDCEDCDGKGKIQVSSYDQAVSKLKDEANLSEEDAKMILDKEIKRLKKAKHGDQLSST